MPGFYGTPMRADDERLMPLYELCQALGVPAFVMSGPTTPDLRLNDPFAVDRVAKTFPKLPIVCCHGFYPHVDAMVTVAFRNENVFVSPDMYTFAPGGRLYVEAANGFMRDQFLFGSSFPFRAMGQGVEDFTRSAWRPDVLEPVFVGKVRAASSAWDAAVCRGSVGLPRLLVPQAGADRDPLGRGWRDVRPALASLGPAPRRMLSRLSFAPPIRR